MDNYNVDRDDEEIDELEDDLVQEFGSQEMRDREWDEDMKESDTHLPEFVPIVLPQEDEEAKTSDYDDGFEMIPEKDWADAEARAIVIDSSPIKPSETSLGKRKAISEPSTSPKAAKTRRKHASFGDQPKPTQLQYDPGVSDGPVIIAHSERHQHCFDRRSLSYGVQWEIARFVSLGKLEMPDIPIPRLDELKGTNSVAAPKVPKVLPIKEKGLDKTPFPGVASAKEIAARSPWEELDREEDALASNPYGALGFNDKYPDWYGGKIHFCGILKEAGPSKAKNVYHIALDRAELGSSNRFARRFGSKRFIRIKIHSQVLHREDNGLTNYFSRPFILNGRVFRAFYAKEDNVFLVQTDEMVVGSRVSSIRIPASPTSPLSLYDFLQWHNPLHTNTSQTMAKWATRFALGLSNSVPGLQLDESDIKHVEDIVSEEKSDMTDGCGLANKVLLRRLWDKFTWNAVPTAIQCRLAGAKGLLLMHPDEEANISDKSVAWIRASQNKIKYDPERPVDPASTIVDVLRASHMKTPGRLSNETIINFSENGVPREAFFGLMRAGLEEVIQGFTTWEGTDAMIKLWVNVSRAGGVISARNARANVGESRAQGYGEFDPDELRDEDEDDLDDASLGLQERSSAWWADEVSGCPSSLEETVMVLLDSGFTPVNCAVLRDKLKQVVKTAINRYILRFRLEVPMSCTAFIVPDPFGVLAPNEIQIKSVHRNLKAVDGLETDTIIGPVLLTRNPCKLPSDTQKVFAVDKPELRNYAGVIVCSIQGIRRFADLLAGGDYDGDKGFALWDPAFVTPFTNADLSYSLEPPSVTDAFSRSNEKIGNFVERTASQTPDLQLRELQRYLFGAIQDTNLVGTYSTYHEKAMYMLGYDHPETIRLAYMFCKVLDRHKTGLILLKDVYASDLKYRYNNRLLPWKPKQDYVAQNVADLLRPGHLGIFRMDEIKAQAKKEGDVFGKKVDTYFPKLSRGDGIGKCDPDLLKPWEDQQVYAKRCLEETGSDRRQQDLDSIASHVKQVYKEHRERLRQATAMSKGSGFTDLPIVRRQDTLRRVSKQFASGPLPESLLMMPAEITRIRASCAYWIDSKMSSDGWSRFPWDVAMRELCTIKAESIGHKTSTEQFYQKFTIKA